MGDQQELEQLRARVAVFETAKTVGSAIDTAISQSGVTLCEGAKSQLVELLRPAVSLHAGLGGQVTGPSGMPIGDFVRQTLAQPNYAHFVQPAGGAPSPANPPSPADPSPAASIVRERLSGESTGAAIARIALADRAASLAAQHTAPTNMAQPFGIRPRPRGWPL
jgi:hypothetical protein